MSVVALTVFAMPEGLPLALTMALTITSNLMVKKKVIVKKLNYVESDEKSYDNLLSYTSKWEKKQDGFYYQTIKEYEFRYKDDVQKVYDNFINVKSRT